MMISQTEDCTIYRLVAAGTIEETQYKHQLYKQQMSNMVMEGKLERRYFSGVQGVQGQEGELFGVSNMFRQSLSAVNIIRRTMDIEKAFLESLDPDSSSSSSSSSSSLSEKQETNVEMIVEGDPSEPCPPDEMAIVQDLFEMDPEKEESVEQILKERGVVLVDQKEVIGDSEYERRTNAASSSLLPLEVNPVGKKYEATDPSPSVEAKKEEAKKWESTFDKTMKQLCPF